MTRRGWLSFVDTSQQDADGGEVKLLGVCVVEVDEHDIEVAREQIAKRFPDKVEHEGALFAGACLMVSFRDGCNVGGEVMVIEVPDEVWAAMELSGVKPSRMLTPELLDQWARRQAVVDNEAAP